MRRFRETHPITAAWWDHFHNSKKRGIAVLWSFEEFKKWCEETGYHLLRKDGWQIHRLGDTGPYAYGRVRIVKAEVNRWAQDIYGRNAQKRA